MANDKNYVSFRCEVTISVYCPRPDVDHETVEEAARAAIIQNCEVVPRRWKSDSPDGPVFEVSTDIMEMEKEDDWLDEDRPQDFDAANPWWVAMQRVPL